MTQTVQTGFVTTIAEKVEAADTEVVVAVAPTVTKGRFYVTNGAQEEWFQFSGVSSTTLQNCTRWLSQTAIPATAGTGKTWLAGTVIELVIMHDQLYDRLEGDAILASATVYASTAARDTALWADGAATKAYFGIYVTATGLHYNYNLSSNQWEAVDTGTTTPNGTTAAAGIYELSTTAEITSGAALGATGASLVMTPADLAKQIQSGSWIYWVDAGGDDAYVVALTPVMAAYTAGQVLWFKVTTTNTGAATVTFGPSVLNIKTKDGNDPQSGVIRTSGINYGYYDGTNYVLFQEDFATTSNRGVLELATDAEAYARSDTARAVTPANLAAITQKVILQTTRTSDAADGAVTIAHGLSQIPKWCMIHGVANNSASSTITGIHSYWFSDGTNNMCSWIGTTDDGASTGTDAWNDNNSAIHLEVGNSSGERVQQASITFDATNVIITWAKTSTNTDPAVTFYITLFVHT